MKKIVWDKCKGIGTIDDFLPKNGKACSIEDDIREGMGVSSRYGNVNVHMDITSNTGTGVFLATIKYFEPVSTNPPKDLLVGDVVQIARENICWVFERSDTLVTK